MIRGLSFFSRSSMNSEDGREIGVCFVHIILKLFLFWGSWEAKICNNDHICNWSLALSPKVIGTWRRKWRLWVGRDMSTVAKLSLSLLVGFGFVQVLKTWTKRKHPFMKYSMLYSKFIIYRFFLKWVSDFWVSFQHREKSHSLAVTCLQQ